MPAKDLISKWEDALAQVLQKALDEGPYLNTDEDLEQVAAGVALRSMLRAGGGCEDVCYMDTRDWVCE